MRYDDGKSSKTTTQAESPTVLTLLASQPLATTQTNYLYATAENRKVATITQTQTPYQT